MNAAVIRLARRYRYWLALAAVTGAYVGAAKVGLKLSVAHGVITPVWPPAGISLAALLIFGLRLWPAVALGAFVSNATTGASPGVAAAIAVGNTVEALVGAYLLRRAGFRLGFDRVRDVLAFIVLAAVFSTTMSATNGVTTLSIAGASAAESYGPAWRLWWLGDAMGDLLVAPLLLVWAARFPRFDRRRLTEALGLLGVLAAVSCVVFLTGLWRYPYLLFPLLIWATFRFKQFGAATASFVVTALAVAGVVTGLTPTSSDTTRGVEVLQASLAAVAVSLLILAATLWERERAEAALEEAHESLAEAQALAHVGSWAWEIGRDRVTWSDELYRIFGVARGADLDYESYRARLDPADRERIERMIERALAERTPFEFTHRIVRPDGQRRVVQGRGRVVTDESGVPVRMLGTAQDVTERTRLEEVRESILASVSHELRTPLTSILGFALTLKERGGQLPRRLQAEIVRNLTQQAQKLDSLLSDLLDLDRLRHGRVPLELGVHRLGPLLERAVAAHGPDGHVVEIAGTDVVAEVDAAKVERIVENLVANALKYTPAGTRIEVAVEEDGEGGVIIRVDDDGPGVEDADKAEIFELFSRAHENAGSASGAGVGLALVARFAALHGGRAWVEDGARGGASFRVQLPARR